MLSLVPRYKALMVPPILAVASHSPSDLTAAFNPLTLNLCVMSLAVIGWVASRTLPSARSCLRVAGETR
jgi:hypothetical protein